RRQVAVLFSRSVVRDSCDRICRTIGRRPYDVGLAESIEDVLRRNVAYVCVPVNVGMNVVPFDRERFVAAPLEISAYAPCSCKSFYYLYFRYISRLPVACIFRLTFVNASIKVVI